MDGINLRGGEAERERLFDLRGIELTISHSGPFLSPDMAVVKVVERDRVAGAPGRETLTGIMAVPSELLDDSVVPIEALIEARMDRTFRPWRYPDRNPFPVLVLFPRLRWLARRLRPGRATAT